MKTPKCPLCGTNSEYFLCAIGTNPYYATKEYVSKFPPIMRLGQGDNVMVRFSDDTHTVLYTNVDRGKIYLQDVYGNALPYDVDEIKQWPWELEQKGGSNDIAQLIVVLVSIFSFGYYLYLAGQYKGFLKAIEVYLKYEEKENEDDA